MYTVNDFIVRLLPHGANRTSDHGGKDWQTFPRWPPDLFAVTAYLVERSGCYSHPRYTEGYWTSSLYDDNYILMIQFSARMWANLSINQSTDEILFGSMSGHNAIKEIQRRWECLAACQEPIEPCDSNKPSPAWCDDAMWLLAVADEASAGIGFFRPRDEVTIDRDLVTQNSVKNLGNHENPFVDFWMRQYIIWDLILYLHDKSGPQIDESDASLLRANLLTLFEDSAPYISLLDRPEELRTELRKSLELPHLSSSLCMMVPRIEACVQPKTRSSAVGCTLRSLSHHLALLPPASQVETRWRVSNRYMAYSKDDAGPQALNLLLVPFPYNIQGTCFRGDKRCVGSHRGDWNDDGVNKSRFFSLEQKWLSSANGIAVDSNEMSKFLSSLISTAQREVEIVHGVVLPELALTVDLAEGVAENLCRSHGIELFIAGVLAPARQGRGPKNCVYTFVMRGGDGDEGSPWTNRSWLQAKHHRWKLEGHQIRRYHLGGRLDPHIDWWEHIDISPRQCFFGSLRHEACLTALICEDLARIDPVQTVIRSIGPNLVVALLMDGPQIERRWSGRYATVLADDPGSAVLTLTSLGLINRSVELGKTPDGQIGLWKDAGGEKATELVLPSDHHALLLTLSYKRDITFTLDGRPDVNRIVSLSRSGYHAIKHADPPVWLL